MSDQLVIKSYIEFRDGAARITGTHHKAEYVGRMHIDGDMSVEEVAEHYGLSAAQVHAAVAFCLENKVYLDAESERIIREGLESGDIIRSEDLKARIEARRNKR